MRWLRTAACAALMASTVTACGSGGEQTTSSPGQPTKLVVGLLPIGSVAPAHLGLQKGFFRTEGLEVEFRTIQGGAEAVPMLMRNEIQFSFGNSISMAFAQQQGIDLQIVTEGAQGGASDKDSAHGLLVRADSDIREPADLAGKTFAVNALKGLGEVTTKTALEKKGVDTSDIKFIEIDHPEMGAALEQGAFDVAWMTEPFMSQLLAGGNRQVMDVVTETAPHLSLSAYFGTTKYIQQQPDVTARFKRAMNASLDYAAAHEAEVRAIIPTYTKVAPAVAKTMRLQHWTSELNESSIRLLIAQATKYGMFKKDIDVDALLGAKS